MARKSECLNGSPQVWPRRFRCRRGGNGFALIVTLAMVTLLSIVVVAFLSTVRSEQATARAYVNLNRAGFAADAGVQMAMATMRGLFEACPDSVTFWGALSDAEGALLTEGTFLYDAATERYHPLFSGAIGQLAATLGDAVQLVDPDAPFEAPDNSVDLNRPRFPEDAVGWIGSPTGEGRKVIRAPWVEMSDPAQPDRVTGRYAFWIEDESFRYHLNEVGSAPRRQGDGHQPSEIPLQPLLEALGDGTPDATAGGMGGVARPVSGRALAGPAHSQPS